MSAVSKARVQAPPALPRPGRYRHFKGGEYELLSLGRHSETDEWLALYRALEKPDVIWVRPLEMFTECVEHPEGRLPRFRPAPAPPPRRPRLVVALALMRMLGSFVDRRGPSTARSVLRRLEKGGRSPQAPSPAFPLGPGIGPDRRLGSL